GALRTRTFLFLGAHTLGSVGPKSRMQFAPAAAARCEMPLSCPMKIERSSTAARWGSRKFLAKRTIGSFHSRSNSSVCALSASPEMTTTEGSPRDRSHLSLSIEKSRLRENKAIHFSKRPVFLRAAASRMNRDNRLLQILEKLPRELSIS